MKIKMRNNIIRVCFPVAGILVFSLTLLMSCKSKKEAASATAVQTTNVLEAVSANMVHYNTLSANFKAQIRFGKNNKKMTVPATLRMIKNEKLQLSFQIPLLGVEAYRLIISADSLLLIDRLNKAYVAESLGSMKEKTNFAYELSNLQALLSSQLFLPGIADLTEKDWPQFRVEQSQDHAFIYTVDKQKIHYNFTAIHYKIRSIEMSNTARTTTLSCSYDRYAKASDNQLFPMEMKFLLKLPDDQLSGDFSFSSVEIDKQISVDFSIPVKYQRITLAQVIHLIQSFS